MACRIFFSFFVRDSPWLKIVWFIIFNFLLQCESSMKICCRFFIFFKFLSSSRTVWYNTLRMRVTGPSSHTITRANYLYLTQYSLARLFDRLCILNASLTYSIFHLWRFLLLYKSISSCGASEERPPKIGNVWLPCFHTERSQLLSGY